MAYMSQERKKALAPKIKAVLKKYEMKGTISVDHHSELVVKIKSGKLDLVGLHNKVAKADQEYRYPQWGEYKPSDYVDINPYHYSRFYEEDEEIVSFLSELLGAMNEGNHDNSDIQTDYFDVGWYVSVRVGSWNSPYVLEGEKKYG